VFEKSMISRTPPAWRNAIKNAILTPLFCLLAFSFVSSLSGCASQGSPQNPFNDKELKRLLEQRQNAKAAAESADASSVPEMTAEDNERRGDDYLKDGKIDMAYLQYSSAVSKDPTRAGARYKSGGLLLKKGLGEEARKVFETLLKDDPKNALLHEGLGKAYFMLAEFKKAQSSFQLSVELDPGLWEPHNFLGIIYDRGRLFDKALEEYKKAASLRPDIGALFNNMGLSYYSKGEYTEAVGSFKQALAAGPADRKIYNNLALALSGLGRDQEAFEAFRLAGGTAAAYNNMGLLHMKKGEYALAVKAFEKAIEVNPRFDAKARENMLRAKKTAAAKSAQPTATPASGVLSIEHSTTAGGTVIWVLANGAIENYYDFDLEKPSRIIIDVWGVKNSIGRDSVKIGAAGIDEVRLGAHPDKLRLVFYCSPGAPPARQINVVDNAIIITIPKEQAAGSARKTVEAAPTGDKPVTADNNKGSGALKVSALKRDS